MIHTVKRLLLLGVTGKTTDTEKKRVVLTNLLAWVSFLPVLAHIFYMHRFSPPSISYAIYTIMGTQILVLILNSFQKYIASRILLITGLVLSIFTVNVTGGILPGSFLYYFPTFVLAFVLISSKRPLLQLAVFLLIVFSATSAFWYIFQYEPLQPPPQRLVRFLVLFNFGVVTVIVVSIIALLVYQNERAEEFLAKEKQKSQDLLHRILPDQIANEIIEKGEAKPRDYESVSVLFTDFVGFTNYAKSLSPADLLKELDTIFLQFDHLSQTRKVEKLKTIGDAYMAASGLPVEKKTHAQDICLVALAMVQLIEEHKKNRMALQESEGWDIRIGIHSGPVVAGVVGKNRFTYDIWGDAVNVASRMEAASEPGKITISESTKNLVSDYFLCTHRGTMEIKNRGQMDAYFLERIHPRYSADELGMIPTKEFLEILKHSA